MDVGGGGVCEKCVCVRVTVGGKCVEKLSVHSEQKTNHGRRQAPHEVHTGLFWFVSVLVDLYFSGLSRCVVSILVSVLFVLGWNTVFCCADWCLKKAAKKASKGKKKSAGKKKGRKSMKKKK